MKEMESEVLSIAKTLRDFLGGAPQLICLDIDGVLTISRSSFLLDLEVVELLRRVHGMGIEVCLATANAHPVARGLSRYLGFESAVIAENGCLADIRGRLSHLVEGSAREVALDIAKRFGLEESWQNIYRHHDYALNFPKSMRLEEVRRVVEEIASYVAKRYPGYGVRYSGYALHIYPKGCSKGRALEFVARELGLDIAKTVAVGDSEVDAEMLRVAGVGAAVGDADDAAKAAARIVLPGFASGSTRVLLEAIALIALGYA